MIEVYKRDGKFYELTSTDGVTGSDACELCYCKGDAKKCENMPECNQIWDGYYKEITKESVKMKETLYDIDKLMTSELYDNLDPKVKKEFKLRLFRLKTYMDLIRLNGSTKKGVDMKK